MVSSTIFENDFLQPISKFTEELDFKSSFKPLPFGLLESSFNVGVSKLVPNEKKILSDIL